MSNAQSFSIVNLPDGVEIERFARAGNDISGGAFQVGGPCFRYRLTADADGRVVDAFLEQNLGSPRSTSTRARGLVIRGTKTEPAEERTVQVSEPTSLFALRFLASVDPVVRNAPKRVGDSKRVRLANFRLVDTGQVAKVARISTDSVLISHPSFELRIRVSPELDMLGGTTIANGAVVAQWRVVRME